MEVLKKSWPFLLGLIISASLLWPQFAAPSYPYHDDVTFIRLFEMDKCFKDGQIPCRWVPDLGNLYGYPLFNYYAPLPYYFGELIYFFTTNIIFSVKIMFVVSFIGSYIFMYLLARKFWGPMGGALSAIFYSLAPYHAVDFYVRGALGEMWGLMFFPAIFWAFTRLQENSNIRNMLLAGLFPALLATSHNLSTFLFLLPTVIWIAVLYFKKRAKQFLFFSLGSIVIAFGLASFYILPAIVEKDLVHVDSTTSGYFFYTEHFKGFKKLLGNYFGYGGSFREVPGGPTDGIPYQIGWVHLLGFLISIYTAWMLWKKKRWFAIVLISSAVMVLVSAFMINPRSEFIWKTIEPLKYLQFPWRFLMLVIFFISFLAGSFSLLNFKYKNHLWAVLLALVFAMNFSNFKPEFFTQDNDKEILSGQNWERRVNRAIFDFLPIYSKDPPGELAAQRYQILTGDTKISDFKEGTNWINFSADTKTHSIIRLSQYYFPDWKIFVDGIDTKIEYKDNSLGLMTIILGEGNHKIEAKLFDTPVRSISNMITSLTAVLFLLLFVTSFKKVRGLITYYRRRAY